MLVQRIVGVLCCLALCGCVLQPKPYVLQRKPIEVVQAKDYMVMWPEISWRGKPIGVNFIIEDECLDFLTALKSRLNLRGLLRPVNHQQGTVFTVAIKRMDVSQELLMTEKESLYYRSTPESLLMQFDRNHISLVNVARAGFSIKKGNNTIIHGNFEGRIPDAMAYCDNFNKYVRLPKLKDQIYKWAGVKILCLRQNTLAEPSLVVQKMAEIFAGDMEELIIGLMKP